MNKSNPQKKHRPRVAVIGAGIFGTNTAIDLADFADVTVYEKRSGLLQEGSFINQFRHHVGYHYPRSPETVFDIQRSAASFEDRYAEALVNTTPTYYGIAKEDSRVDAETFLTFCKDHRLHYSIEKPEAGYLQEDALSLIIKVPEPSYHYQKLTSLIEDLLIKEKEHVHLNFNQEVIYCEIGSAGEKILSVKGADGVKRKEKFDFVINATYAHLNNFTKWLNLEPFPVRIDLVEVLIVKIPGPPISLTIMDGPFATIMPTGNPNEYTLYHVRESILNQYTPGDGLVAALSGLPASQKKSILEKSKAYFPFLEEAEVVESRIVHRGVLAHHEHDDCRVADIINHSNGCWSVLSGKILSSVYTSKQITHLIKKSLN